MTETGIRVALADDDVLLREGLASLLKQSGFAVVGQCGDGSQLIAVIRKAQGGTIPPKAVGLLRTCLSQ